MYIKKMQNIEHLTRVESQCGAGATISDTPLTNSTIFSPQLTCPAGKRLMKSPNSQNCTIMSIPTTNSKWGCKNINGTITEVTSASPWNKQCATLVSNQYCA